MSRATMAVTVIARMKATVPSAEPPKRTAVSRRVGGTGSLNQVRDRADPGLGSLLVSSGPASQRRQGDPAKPVVLFVSSPPGLGGSNISLATVMAGLAGRVHRVLAGPDRGAWGQLVDQRDLADEKLVLEGRKRSGRIRNSIRIARYVRRHRNRLTAIHANATTGLFLSALASRVADVPVVVWVHDPVTTSFGVRVGPWVRRLVKTVHFAAVTEVAAQVAVESGLCERRDIQLIPNPIAPEEVVPETREPSDRVRIGYLGSATHRKGFDILADVADLMTGSQAQFRLFTLERRDEENQAAWEQMDPHRATELVAVPGIDNDVRRVYAQCDIVFNPSRDESFCRVAAEAMANGLPVVAGDIPALRALLGDNEAGVLYSVEDRAAAAAALRRLAADPALREQLGDEGRKRAAQFMPGPVIEALASLYGLDASTSA